MRRMLEGVGMHAVRAERTTLAINLVPKVHDAAQKRRSTFPSWKQVCQSYRLTGLSHFMIPE